MNTEIAENLVMWKCNKWGGDKCDFKIAETEHSERRNLKTIGKVAFG